MSTVLFRLSLPDTRNSTPAAISRNTCVQLVVGLRIKGNRHRFVFVKASGMDPMLASFLFHRMQYYAIGCGESLIAWPMKNRSAE